jgi:hypothetical protein
LGGQRPARRGRCEQACPRLQNSWLHRHGSTHG